MAQARVWTSLPLYPGAVALLEGTAKVSVSTVGEHGDWLAEAAGAEVIMVRGSTFVTGEVMDRLGPRLRIVARTGIGIDRIDLNAATERGIMVINAPDGPTESTAEHAIALLLNLSKQVMVGDRILRSGSAFPALTTLTPGMELFGTTLGLVGLGRVGSRVALIAQILGMQVLAYDPFLSAERTAALGVTAFSSLEELLPRVQVLSLHCPATAETRYIINATTLKLLPRGSYLINVARGALVDHAALLDSLRSGHLAGAGLDVFDPEPPPAGYALFDLPNTICTPHIGSYTVASLQRMHTMTCEQVAAALRGERPANLVNSAVWGHQRI